MHVPFKEVPCEDKCNKISTYLLKLSVYVLGEYSYRHYQYSYPVIIIASHGLRAK